MKETLDQYIGRVKKEGQYTIDIRLVYSIDISRNLRPLSQVLLIERMYSIMVKGEEATSRNLC